MADNAEQPTAHPTASEDVKAKFKEALERKKSGGNRGAAGTSNEHGKVHGEHGAEAHQKQFRRKAGG